MNSNASRVAPHVLAGRDGVTETLLVEQLAFCSSHVPGKDRWFEVAIYRKADGNYVVHTVGRSTRVGDKDLARIVHTNSPSEIIELLTVTHEGRTYLPRPSARAVAQAADMDDRIREAYLELVA